MRYFLVLAILLSSCGDSLVERDVPLPSQKNIPQHLSWADIDTNEDGLRENYLTSIKSQPCSDCYIYAAAALYEIQFNIDHGIGGHPNLSEQNIHNCLKIRCDNGGDYRHILDYIRDFGVLDESFVPVGHWGVCDNCKSQLGWTDPTTLGYYRLKSYSAVYPDNTPYNKRRSLLVKALQRGPIVIHVGSWSGYKMNGNILHCVENLGGSHAVVLVGYRNRGESFLVKNSHNDPTIWRVTFSGGDVCRFAFTAHQIDPFSTYVQVGGGESFCYTNQDSDNDGITNPHDNCPHHYNPNQENWDLDPYGDACDLCPYFFGSFETGCP